MLSLFRRNCTIGPIRYFSFGFSRSCVCNANVVYRLQWESGGYIASVKPMGEPEENSKTTPVSEEFVRKLANLLTKYRVGRWNGFQKTDNRVADGRNFSLTVINADQSRISAQGYMRYPRDYPAVKQEIEALFSEIFV